MRTRRATRFNHQREHKQYGIYNWFKNRLGVTDTEEVIFYINEFCKQNGFEKEGKKYDNAKINFVDNRFSKFCSFVSNQYNKILNSKQ